ncbi:hypothetical protein AB0M20_22745 [Actinoplanes sp. NPDC051633]|uniref:hypothetical protein n=1 Tax=Actinoplanes sp. NPDC051633 TaxID=3155670 RepID=UPI00342C4553
MTRTRITLLALTTAALVGLTACGAGPAASPDLAAEASALQAVGFETGLEAPAPAASDSASDSASAKSDRAEKRQQRRQNVRKYLRKNTLHGEIAVQGKDGVQTIVVQRGTVTATDGRTISVKSADGFALTWTVDDQLKVVQDRKKAEASAIKAGAEVGVAGVREGTATTARLVAIG